MAPVIETIVDDYDPYAMDTGFEPTSDYLPRPNTTDPDELVGNRDPIRMGPPPVARKGTEITLPTLHADQAKAWWKFHLSGKRRFILRCGRRYGKALALDTPIPTPTGWTTMGDLEVGDWLFDEAGTPCQVTYATNVQIGRPCNRVVFSDGSEIIADDDHRWSTWDKSARKNAKRNTKSGWHGRHGPKVRTTKEIASTLTSNSRGDRNHSIPLCGAVQCDEAALSINPYVLGVWLGDGTSRLSEITCADQGILDELRREGQAVYPGRDPINFKLDQVEHRQAFGPASLLYRLKSLGLQHNKHIPPQYLRASIAQRLALLQGLMDTDGYCGTNSQCEFVNTSERLARGVYELALSLGIRAVWSEGRAKINGRDCGPKYRINFMTDLPVFRLERKLVRQRARKITAGRNIDHRFIVDVVPIDSVPVRCIQVDSPNHLFLAGANFIPTHNTDFGKLWLMDAVVRGGICAWYAPEHKTWSEAYSQMVDHLGPLIAPTGSSKNAGVIRLKNGGRIDWWTMGSPISGRGRFYHRVVIDEAAFGKDGDKTVDGSTMAMWDLAIEPTLHDYGGEVLIMSNSAGKNPDNFLYMISPEGGDGEGQHGFVEHHATMADNPLLPHRKPGESYVDWQVRRTEVLAERKRTRDPLAYAQEDMAEFVDWSGKAFFTTDKWMINDQPVAYPKTCDGVFATIDTAIKTGYENDGTAVVYWAIDKSRPPGHGKLIILDWDIIKIEGASLVTWLPGVYKNLAEMALTCGSRSGDRLGAFIEDKGSGTVLLQQAARAGWKAHPIDSALTAMGKDERALNASPYHYQGLVKIADVAWTKTTTYNGQTRNHFTEQVQSFRMADKDAGKRQDDLLDAYTYGISVALGGGEGF
jgi:hypothetical protein